jgi:signal transduction histidine kinase
MSALIDAVQVYTGLDAADQMERASIDLADVLKQVQENLAQLIETREATITCDALPRVHANEAQMLQLLQNLVANAIWHRDSAVTIHVEAKDYGSQWLLTVQDDGPGIAPKNLEAIFDPFTRLSHHDDGAPGPGLGLAIIRKIVESYGGLIWCESHLGMGTCFLFTLPKMTAVVAVSSDDVVHIAPPSLLPASAHRYV